MNQKNFMVVVDSSSVDNCETTQARLIVNEDDLCNDNACELMHDEIDKMIREIYSHWKYDFVIVDAANEESILSSSDSIRVFAIYKEIMNINVNDNQVDSRILFKMKLISPSKSNIKNKLKQDKTIRYTRTT